MLDITTAAQLIDALNQLAYDTSVNLEDVRVNIGGNQTRAELTVSIEGLDLTLEPSAPTLEVQDRHFSEVSNAIQGYMEDCIGSSDFRSDRKALAKAWDKVRIAAGGKP